jgi:Phytanoyl-CoA dioxygenase (PhyH)
MTVVSTNENHVTSKVDAIVEAIRNDGLAVIPDVLTLEQCDRYRGLLGKQFEERLQAGSYCGNETNQVLDNYFMTYPELLEMIHQDITDQVMRRLIDDDYVLISPSARNRRILTGMRFGRRTSGVGWHVDSRFLGGRGIQPSLSYLAILCLDDFEKDNGATHYIPCSHKRYQRPPDRHANLPFESMLMPKGGMAIIDSALWHRVGEPSTKSRWGIFNTYGPWFMKPYHRFNEMFSEAQAKEFPPIIRQLLHYDSIPPKDHDESMITLCRVRKAVEGI